MMLRNLSATLVLGGMIGMAWADPVILGPAQMDSVTAAGNDSYSVTQASANGRSAFTATASGAVSLNGGSHHLAGYGGGGQGAAIAFANGPAAHLDISSSAGYGAAGDAVAQAVANGPSTFAAISAGVARINGQSYLTGYLIGGVGAGHAIATAPIALSPPPFMTWFPPAATSVVSGPAISETSTNVQGGQLVTYMLTAGDPSGDTSSGNDSKMSLSFFKPPGSRIPPLLPIDISGALPVMSTILRATPVAM